MKSTITVVITQEEIVNAEKPWPGASYDNTLAHLMKMKGLRMQPSVDPVPNDLFQPYTAERDSMTGTLTITQGDEQ